MRAVKLVAERAKSAVDMQLNLHGDANPQEIQMARIVTRSIVTIADTDMKIALKRQLTTS